VGIELSAPSLLNICDSSASTEEVEKSGSRAQYTYEWTRKVVSIFKMDAEEKSGMVFTKSNPKWEMVIERSCTPAV